MDRALLPAAKLTSLEATLSRLEEDRLRSQKNVETVIAVSALARRWKKRTDAHDSSMIDEWKASTAEEEEESPKLGKSKRKSVNPAKASKPTHYGAMRKDHPVTAPGAGAKRSSTVASLSRGTPRARITTAPTR